MGEHRTRFAPGDDVWTHYTDEQGNKHLIRTVISRVVVSASGVLYNLMPQNQLVADDMIFDSREAAQKALKP